MFRVTKKRSKKTRVVTTSKGDNDENGSSEEEGPSIVVKGPKKNKEKKKKKSRAAAPVSMSFDYIEDEQGASSRPLKKRKRGRGMGYGGAPVTRENVDEAVPDQQDEHVLGVEPVLYGKEALERLKSEQRYKAKEVPAKEDVKSPLVATTRVDVGETNKASSNPLPSFIPLNSNETEPESVILTGEDAMNFEDNAPQVELQPNPLLSHQDSKDAQDWEDQVTKRAGIRTSVHSSKNTPNLEKLKQQVHSTMSHLQTQDDDLQSVYDRRLVELAHTREELTKHEVELQNSSKALEHYQELRVDLASWVGALRELHAKLKPLMNAILDLNIEISVDVFKEWQDDFILTLHEAGVLDRVLGRQVKLDTHQDETENEHDVDEFGRNVKSQKVMQRELRARQRRQARHKWQTQHATNDSNHILRVAEHQTEDQKERRNALEEALRVAIQELSEDYTSMSGLFQVFKEWGETYPDDYTQCFASTSLADLVGVLVQVDLCFKMDPLCWNQVNDASSSLQFPWIQSFQEFEQGENGKHDGKDGDTPLQHILDKVLVPAITKLLDKGAYNVFSTNQSQSLSRFCSTIFAISPKSRSVSRLRVRMVQYLRECLESVSIPIIKTIGAETKKSEELEEAIEFATKGQVHRLTILLVNILKHWGSLLNGTPLCEIVLDFVSSHFLLVLSSLQALGSTDLSSSAFRQVWAAAKKTKWLERPDLMLQAAPLRAAAVAFGHS